MVTRNAAQRGNPWAAVPRQNLFARVNPRLQRRAGTDADIFWWGNTSDSKQLTPSILLNSTTMVSITVAPAGKKAPSLARGLPHTVVISKAYADVTVGDVKAALAAKYPKVRVYSLRKRREFRRTNDMPLLDSCMLIGRNSPWQAPKPRSTATRNLALSVSPTAVKSLSRISALRLVGELSS